MGQDFASFLLGLPYSGTYDLNTYGSWYSYYGAGFVQDDWRVKHEPHHQPGPALRPRRAVTTRSTAAR